MEDVDMEEYRKMKVPELKNVLRDKGLKLSGTKEALLERLQKHLDGSVAAAVSIKTDEALDELEGSKHVDSTQAEEVETTSANVMSKENILKTQISDNTGVNGPEKKVVTLTAVPESDRLKARAEKFGGPVSDTTKKLLRAKRFGLPDSENSTSGSITGIPATTEDLEKKKKRAERFGAVGSNEMSEGGDAERKKKRLERFGAVSSSSSSTEIKTVKLSSGDSSVDEKKRKRAERFGLT